MTMERDSLVARPGRVTRFGWERDEEGANRFRAVVVYDEGPPELSFNVVWKSEPVAIVPLADLEAAAALSRPEQVVKRLEMARGHLSNIEAHGNAEANAVLVIRNVLSELEAALCLTTAAPLQADASAPASPAIGVQAVTLDFHAADTTPDVPRGQMKACIIMMRSRHTGKNFTMPAYYLNAYPLEFEDGCGDEKCEDEHDDGCPVSGWFYDNANFEYENCYYRIEGECLAWALIPGAATVEAALHPAPEAASAGVAGEPVGYIHPFALDCLMLPHQHAETVHVYPTAPQEDFIPLFTAPSDTAPSPKGVSDGVREAVERYRLLRIGEVIAPTDEFLKDDATTWQPCRGEWCVGATYTAIFQPMRRDIEAALSQEHAPATAEDRAASKEGA